jgi:hypothetical protein
MTKKTKGETIVILEKLRLIESEIFRLSSKYGVKTVDDLDNLIAKGKLSENDVGEDLFILDYLLEEKNKLEKELKKLSLKKTSVWENLQNLLELPKLNFRT